MADIQSNINVNIDTSNALASIKLLQSQISAFHTSMAKGGAQATAASGQLQQKLLDSINATGKFSASIQNIKSTTESFTTSLEKNKFSLGEYFRYAGGASKSFGRFFTSEMNTVEKVARERVKSLQTQYIALGRDANGALRSISIRPLMLDLDNLQTKTAIAAQKQQILNQLLMQGSTNLLNFGKNTQWAGRQLMVGFTIPLSMAGTAAAKAYMDMEKAAIKIKRVYGDLNTSAKETNQAVESIRNLAAEYTKYGVAVADTMEMAATAAAMGKTGADLLAQVNEATRLSALGGVQQAQALETTISLTSAFGLSTEQLSQKINYLNAVENQTVTSIEDLTIAIPKAGPVIKQLGGNVEDLAFFLTAMREGGINASEGANALKSGLAALINPTSKASDMLAGFGINIKAIVEGNKGDLKKTVVDFATALNTIDPLNRARAIEQMFGKFQFARISTLLQNVTASGSQASKALALANMSSIQLAAMSRKELDKISASPMYKFEKAIADLQVKIAPVGETFLKAVTPIIGFVSKMLDGFNGMSDQFKNFAVIGVAVIGGLAPVLLMVVGLVANGAANILKFLTKLKSFFNRTSADTKDLGASTSYLTEEQIKAEAVAASLDQVHSRLKQTFTSEAAAVDMLTGAYERSIAAQAGFAGSPVASGTSKPATGMFTPVGKTKGYATGGVVQGPGTGTSDSVPANLSTGEVVLSVDTVKKNPALIGALLSGKKINVPGYARQGVAGGTTDAIQEAVNKLLRGMKVKRTGRFGSGNDSQFVPANAPESGHLDDVAMQTADQIIASLQHLGQDAVNEATAQLEKQKDKLRLDGMSEKDTSSYKFKAYTENLATQPSIINNGGKFTAGSAKQYYSDEGALAFRDLARHLTDQGIASDKVRDILISASSNLQESLGKLDQNAEMSLPELNRLTESAVDLAVAREAEAKAVVKKTRETYGTIVDPKTTNQRVPLVRGFSYKGGSNSDRGKNIVENLFGVNEKAGSNKINITNKKLADGGSEYSARTVKAALDTLRKSGGELEGAASNFATRFAALGDNIKEELPILLRDISSSLKGAGLPELKQIANYVVDGYMTDLNTELASAAQTASPSRRTKKVAEDTVAGYVVGLEDGRKAVAAKAIETAAGTRAIYDASALPSVMNALTPRQTTTAPEVIAESSASSARAARTRSPFMQRMRDSIAAAPSNFANEKRMLSQEAKSIFEQLKGIFRIGGKNAVIAAETGLIQETPRLRVAGKEAGFDYVAALKGGNGSIAAVVTAGNQRIIEAALKEYYAGGFRVAGAVSLGLDQGIAAELGKGIVASKAAKAAEDKSPKKRGKSSKAEEGEVQKTSLASKANAKLAGANTKFANMMEKAQTGVASQFAKIGGAATGAAFAMSMIPGPIGEAMQTFTPFIGIVSAASGLMAIFDAELLTATIFIGALELPIWAIAAAFVALAAIIGVAVAINNKINEQKQQELKNITATSRAYEGAKKSIDEFGKLSGVTPGTDMMANARTALAAGVGGKQASDVNILLNSAEMKDPKSAISDTISSVKTMSNVAAKNFLSSYANQLKSYGFDGKTIQAIITAIEIKASKTNLKLKFASIDISTGEGKAQLQKGVADAVAGVDPNAIKDWNEKSNKNKTDAKNKISGAKAELADGAAWKSGPLGWAVGGYVDFQMGRRKEIISNAPKEAQASNKDLLLNNPNLAKANSNLKIGVESVTSGITSAFSQFKGGALDKAGLASTMKSLTTGLGNTAKSAAVLQAAFTKLNSPQVNKVSGVLLGYGKSSKAVAAGFNAASSGLKYLTIQTAAPGMGKNLTAALKKIEDGEGTVEQKAIAAAKAINGIYNALSNDQKNVEIPSTVVPPPGGGGTDPKQLLKDTKAAVASNALMQTLMSKKYNSEFIDAIGGADAVTQKFYVTLANGKRVLSDQGKALLAAFNAKTIGDFLIAQRRVVSGAAAELAARKTLNAAGLDAETVKSMAARSDVQLALLAANATQGAVARAAAIKKVVDALKAEKAATDSLLTKQDEFQKTYDASTKVLDDQASIINNNFDRDATNAANQAKILKANQDIQDLQTGAGKTTGLNQYNNGLSKLQFLENDINKKYEERAKALEKVATINQRISNQQKGQLTLAQALSSGDIAAAAQAAQDMNAQNASDNAADQKAAMDAARQKELDAQVVSVNGKLMTRKQIEDASAVIQQKILDIQIGQLDPAQTAYDLATRTRDASLKAITDQKLAWDSWKLSIGEATDKLDKYNKSVSQASPIAKAALAEINAGGAKVVAKNDDPSTQAQKAYANAKATIANKKSTAAEVAAAKAAKSWYESTYVFADGGKVRGPGTGTSDSIPAWLSNGEYVMKASAVKNIGVANLDMLNNAPKFASGGKVGKAATDPSAGRYAALEAAAKSRPGAQKDIASAQLASANKYATAEAWWASKPKAGGLADWYEAGKKLGLNQSSQSSIISNKQGLMSGPAAAQSNVDKKASDARQFFAMTTASGYLADVAMRAIEGKINLQEDASGVLSTAIFSRFGMGAVGKLGKIKPLFESASSNATGSALKSSITGDEVMSIWKQQLAKNNPNSIPVANIEKAMATTQSQYAEVYKTMLAKYPEELAKAGISSREEFVANIKDIGQMAKGVNDKAHIPSFMVAANKAYAESILKLDPENGMISFYRNGNPSTAGTENMGYYSLDKGMAYSYHPGAVSGSAYPKGSRWETKAKIDEIYGHLGMPGIDEFPVTLGKSTMDVAGRATNKGPKKPLTLPSWWSNPTGGYTSGRSPQRFYSLLNQITTPNAIPSLDKFAGFEDFFAAHGKTVDEYRALYNSKYTNKHGGGLPWKTLQGLFSEVPDKPGMVGLDVTKLQDLNAHPLLKEHYMQSLDTIQNLIGANFMSVRGIPKLAMGGLVTPKYFANGGLAKGTDTIPAMLSPGEFVVKKFAVDNFGVDKLNAINSGQTVGSDTGSILSAVNSSSAVVSSSSAYTDASVYNYSVNVNVRSDANPDQIAQAVMTKINQNGAQRIRGNRFNG
jgi:hypothetical protein